MEWSFHIADEIDDALKAKGMTQKELASALGTSAAAVSRWMGGGHNFTLSTLARISAVLGVPLISVVK
jgi:transcriptional regulator with XRE-family HTH domain